MTNIFGKLSFKTRVQVVVLALLIVGIWALAARAADVLQSDLDRLLSQQMSATVGYVASDIDSQFRMRIDVLSTIAAGISPAMLADPAEAQRYLEQHDTPRALFPTGIAVDDSKGTIIADFPRAPGRRGGFIGDRSYFREVMASGKPQIGRPTVSRFLNKPFVAIAVPLRDAGGATAGVLVGPAYLSDQNLFGQLEQTKLGKTGRFLVVSPKDHLIVSATDKRRIMQALPAKGVNALLDRRLEQGYEGPGITVTSLGVRTLSVSRNLGTTGWIVLAGIATEEAFAPIRTLKTQIYLAAALVSLVLMAVLRLFLARQLAPLADAATAMRRMTSGEASFSPIAVRREDEIGQLLGNFNQLLAERSRLDGMLKEREAQLRLVIENVPAMVSYYDADRKCRFANERYAKFFGFSAREVVGMDLRDVTGEYISRHLEPFWEQVSAGKTATYTRTHHPSPDVLRYFEVSLIPGRGQDGSVSGFYGFALDVTERETTLRALRESEARFRDLTVMSSDWFWEQDEQFRFTLVSGSILNQDRNRPPDAIGKTRWELPAVDVSAEEWATYRKLLEAHQAFNDWEYRIRTDDGDIRRYSVSGIPLFDGEGRFKGYRGTGRDITERVATESQLRLAAAVFDNSHEAIFITDHNNRILTTNSSFSDVTGYAQTEVIGKDPGILASGRHGQEFFAAMWQSLLGRGYWKGEIWDRRKNGEIYPKWLSISTVRDREGKVANFVAIFTDITERKAAEEKIDFLAHHDALTGLPNRLLVRDRLEQATAHADRAASKVALLFLDLDNFKTINDSLGHSVGDALLKAVAARLRECIRDTDTISRQGGDEFLIVLADLPGTDSAIPIVDKLIERFQLPFDADGHAVSTSLSVGVALYPDDGEDLETLQKNADMAMYQAKDAGRNTYRFFDEHMNVEAVEHLSVRNGLRSALEREEFVLHYQPQIDLISGAVLGAEALVRWQHPQLGMVPPGRFIPIAEESGLIVPIGEWVMREACRQAKAWRDAGLPELVVAVNLSSVQFKRGDVERTVIRALEDSGLDPSLLELELTESILLKDTESVLSTVKRLKLLGVKLSIDDFGTGYSSLSYLKRFAVDKLKIDQSFIRDLAIDPEDAAIVRAIIQMARSLGLRTIAEGVEDERILHHLRVFRCDEAQGYHIARPMPAEAFARFLAGTPGVPD